jgi:hypothetical protein
MELELCASRAELDAQNIQLLQEQAKKLEGALGQEQARSEQLATAFADVARASDNRARELEAQFVERLAKLERSHDAVMTGMNAQCAKMEATHDAVVANLKASHAATVAAKDALIADQRQRLANQEMEIAALKAESAAQLSAIHAVVTSTLALELHPTRCDSRQFATLHIGAVPPVGFDTTWCAAACGDRWKVDLDPVTQTRAHVTQGSDDRKFHLTLRGAPLPRRVPSTGASPQHLPSYRVVIEAYPPLVDPTAFLVGFVPSHTSTDGTLVAPIAGHRINNYGGWSLIVFSKTHATFAYGTTVHGWTPLRPRTAAGDAATAETSAYATTSQVPPVPAGSAVEFAVDYAAGTCRVAFYTPAAVAGGFVEAPYARMELRFVATAADDRPIWGPTPARLLPTVAGDMQLHPAVATFSVGGICRLV